MRFCYVRFPHRHVLGAHRSDHKKCTMGRCSEKILHRPHSSDGIDIAEVLRVHHIRCYESVHTIRRFPAEKRSAFQFDVVIVETFIKSIPYPLSNLREKMNYHMMRWRNFVDWHTSSDNMMGRPREISLVDSIRMTVKLMVMRTTPPRNEAAPIRA